jgi:PLP dependent protein
MNQLKIKDNIEAIKKELNSSVLFIAVTKTVDLETVKFLKSLGINDFGENRVSDAEEKITKVKAVWHMIGHLQSNKVKKTVELFDVIQSVDSLDLAKKIDNECEKQFKKMKILLQVNIAREPQKHGFNEEDVSNVLFQISKLKNIRIAGFMMIAPNIDAEKTRIFFRKMKNLFEKHKQTYSLSTLSMGMSNDYKIAVEEGSNMVRIGTRLFE